jgi:hypothetical protein
MIIEGNQLAALRACYHLEMILRSRLEMSFPVQIDLHPAAVKKNTDSMRLYKGVKRTAGAAGAGYHWVTNRQGNRFKRKNPGQ